MSEFISYGHDQGLGLDWGVLFPTVDLAYYYMTKQNIARDNPKDSLLRCPLLEKRKMSVGGACSTYGSCVNGSVQYFGFFCSGLAPGKPCTVKTVKYLTVAGVCSGQGHSCYAGGRSVRYKIMTTKFKVELILFFDYIISANATNFSKLMREKYVRT